MYLSGLFGVFFLSGDQPDQAFSAADQPAQPLVVLFGYYEMGQMAAAVFAQKVCRKSVLLTLIMTLTGFICRFLLEFGEVSNSYNFTLPNVAVHLFLALVIVLVPVLMPNENCSC